MVILITGGSSGIGLAAARALATQHTVLITDRSLQTLRIADEIKGEGYLCDFTQLDNVHTLAAQVRRRHARIDLLVNNAACLTRSFALTEDGHERTLQVNYLAPFLLTHLLQPTLEASHAHVINTSSAAHWMGRVQGENLAIAPGTMPTLAYSRTKLLNLLHAVEINRRIKSVRAVSFHPGLVATAIARDAAFIWRLLTETSLKRMLLSPAKGADTLLWLVEHMHDGTWEPGGYYARRKLALRSPQACDAALAARVWDQTLRILQLDESQWGVSKMTAAARGK